MEHRLRLFTELGPFTDHLLRKSLVSSLLVPGINLDRVVQKVLTALPGFQEILCTQVKGSITRHRVSQQQRPKIKVCRKVT